MRFGHSDFLVRSLFRISDFDIRISFAERRRHLPAEGLEPTRSCDHWILSPARLPVPPRRRRQPLPFHRMVANANHECTRTFERGRAASSPPITSNRDWPIGEPVPAISLRQPWATAVLFFGKDVENRSLWRFKHRGPIIIHASKSVPYQNEIEACVRCAREDGVDEKSLKLFAK